MFSIPCAGGGSTLTPHGFDKSAVRRKKVVWTREGVWVWGPGTRDLAVTCAAAKKSLENERVSRLQSTPRSMHMVLLIWANQASGFEGAQQLVAFQAPNRTEPKVPRLAIGMFKYRHRNKGIIEERHY